eukprot:GILI01041931.1.p1 GENE.GILI01041931.1~~GILI01041931.1.p1  ORF type:complete len:323 (+),score=47.52 GILI01041931.1:282-1250(+)
MSFPPVFVSDKKDEDLSVIPPAPPSLPLSIPLSSPLKPILLLHGLNAGPGIFNGLVSFLRQLSPETPIISLDFYNDLWSLVPLSRQAKKLSLLLSQLQSRPGFEDGYHMICHSQGAVLGRAAVTMTPNHKVLTFVSLAGPQGGLFGTFGLERKGKGVAQKALPKMHHIFYSPIAQRMLSVAQLWRDPAPSCHATFVKRNQFLPLINNETPHPLSEAFVDNFKRVGRVVLAGGPADEQIMPWESCFFCHLSTISSPPATPLPPHRYITELLRTQPVYADDLFGLRSLDEAGRLHLVVLEDANHHSWIFNTDLFREHILPFLKK